MIRVRGGARLCIAAMACVAFGCSVNVDGNRYSCTSNSQCGFGWTCINNVCAPNASSSDAGPAPDASTADASTLTVDSGADSGNDAGAMDAGSADASAGFSPTTLSLVAGQPGGRGNNDDAAPGPHSARFSDPVGLAFDPAGNLYIADTGNDTIRKLALATGTVSTVAGTATSPGGADGVGVAARFSSPWGVVFDATGKLYVSDQGNSTIRAIDLTTGTVSTLAGVAQSTGTADGSALIARFNGPSGLAYDGAGSLYVIDGAGPTNSGSTRSLRKVAVANGATTTLLTSGLAGAAGAALDPTSTILYVAAASIATIYKVTLSPLAVTTLSSGAPLNGPTALVYGASNNLYVTDQTANAIRAIAINTGLASTIAGNPGVVGDSDAVGTAATFTSPVGIAFDGAGTLYVSDTGNSTVRRISTATQQVTTLAGVARVGGTTDSTGLAARFYFPTAVTIDPQGNIYVADTLNLTIRRIDPAGNVVTVAGEAGIAGSTDGNPSLFNSPYGVAADNNGNVFIADTENETLRALNAATLNVVTVAGMVGQASLADGSGAAARFHTPAGLVYDGNHYLYVADAANSAIRQVDISACESTLQQNCAAVVTICGGAASGLMDGTGPGAQFNGPLGVAYDPTAATVYVGDTGNGRVRRVVNLLQNAGVVSTLAPTFGEPEGMAADGSGSLYVVETSVHTVHQVTLSTQADAVIAGLAGTAGYADGIGTLAFFNSPQGLALDATNKRLLVADAQNYSVRQVELSYQPAWVQTVAGLPTNAATINADGASARFGFPEQIASDGADSVFVTDVDANGIREVNVVTGATSYYAGGVTRGCMDGMGTGAEFISPQSVFFDVASQTLYVGDTGCNWVRKVTAGGVVTTVVSSGLTQPVGLALGSPQSLYVADTGDNTIVLVDLTGTNAPQVVAGGGTGSEVDGMGTAAEFAAPWGLAADGKGKLYISDENGNSIRVMDLSTNYVSTLVKGLAIPNSLLLDGAGNLYFANYGDATVREISLANCTAPTTCPMRTVIGSAGFAGVVLGPLPAGLNAPVGLAFGPGPSLVVSDHIESSILRAW